MKIRLLEDDNSPEIHVYMDDSTGDCYIYDGSKFIKVDHKDIDKYGYMPDEEDFEEEDRQREEQARKEAEEDGESLETEEERQQRIDRIKDMFDNEDVVQQLEDEARSPVEAQSEYGINQDLANMEDAEKPTDTASSLERFQEDMDEFIKDQIAKVKQKSWKKPNMSYEGSGISRRGNLRRFEENIPLINVYFDQSGSWDDKDIKLGKKAIGILDKYVERGEIEYKLYYFANHVHSDARSARREGGTSAAPEIIDHIIATDPSNVIIMTDGDFDTVGNLRGNEEFGIEPAPIIRVPGAVWYLFKKVESEDIQKHLNGEQQTKVYII